VLRNQVAEAQTLVQLAHEDQAAIGGEPRSLELDLQRGVEREPKGLVCGLTIGYRPPPRHRRAQTRFNKDIRRIPVNPRCIAKSEIHDECRWPQVEDRPVTRDSRGQDADHGGSLTKGAGLCGEGRGASRRNTSQREGRACA